MKRLYRTTAPGAACVYLLLRRDRARFKLGWSRNPASRICSLPEFANRQLDLAASKAIWLPSRPRAEQVERSMHKALGPYRVLPGHRLDGCQEWFAGQAEDAALRLLRQMPLDDSGAAKAQLAPLLQPAPAGPELRMDRSPERRPERGPDPLSVWWGIEDLLLRLAMRCRISVAEGEAPVVTVHGLKASRDSRLLQLRGIAVDADRWQCWQDGRPLSFVRTLGWEGDDLVLHFMPLRCIERWEEGPDLAMWVRSLLARLALQEARHEPQHEPRERA